MALKKFNAGDFESWERFYRANFFNSAGGFKSLNLIGTRSSTGITNLGLFFSVIHVGANPPFLGVLFRPHTVARHTLENILDTGFFTVNAVQLDMLPQAHQASAKYDKDESEFTAVGLREFYSSDFPVPYVEESRIKLGCRFVEKHEIKANATLLLVGKIEECWVDSEALLEDGFIDHSKVNGITVNGLDTYYTAMLEKRYKYARPGQNVEEK